MFLVALVVAGLVVKAKRWAARLDTPIGSADRLQVYLACVVALGWLYCCGSDFANTSAGFFPLLKWMAGLAVLLLLGLVLEYPRSREANLRAAAVLAAPAFHVLWPSAPRELQCVVLLVSVVGIYRVVRDNRWAIGRLVSRLLGDG